MCSYEWIGLHFPKGLSARRKAIFRRLVGFERPENSPVDCFQWFERPENSPVDCFQQERVARPLSNGSAGPGGKSREINAENQFKTP